MGIFEAAGSENITYDKLYTRYNAGLKYLGIIHAHVKAVCSKFLSSQLADHMYTQIKKANVDDEYVPASILQNTEIQDQKPPDFYNNFCDDKPTIGGM